MSLRLQPVDLSNLGWTPTTKESTDIANGLVSTDPLLATPIDTLTTESLSGTGTFDVLMRATKLHLQEEYDAQRITGHEYATVYLGALSAVLQTATQFLMNGQQVNLLNAQIGLIRQQTVTELSNTDDSIPIGLGFNRVPDTIVTIQPDASYGDYI
jgi:hypothetical protein